MRGGARNYFKIPTAITDGASLQENVGFFNVVGHGVLNDRIFRVPENTFILFMGGAGMPIIRPNTQLPELAAYRFLNAGETVEQWHQRTYESIRDRTFFGSMLYKNNAPYASGTTAIYEPGDIVQDIDLSFENNSHPYMLLGIWICPITHQVRVDFDNINKEIKDEIEALKQGLNNGDLTVDEFGATVDLIRNGDKGKAWEVSLISNPQNIGTQMRIDKMHESSLYEVVHKLKNNGLASAKPIRFIVVEACRSVSQPGGIPINNLQHIFRKHRQPIEMDPSIVKRVEAYEKRAFPRRRLSLLARQFESAAAAGGAAAGGGGGGGGAAEPSQTYVKSSISLTMRNLARLEHTPSLDSILSHLEANRPVSVQALEDVLSDHLKSAKDVINADYRALVSGLAPEKRFLSGDLVLVPPGKTGIVIGPVVDEGTIKFKVTVLEEIEPGVVTADEQVFDPLTIGKLLDQSKKAKIIQSLATVGYDVEFTIVSHLSGLDAILAQAQNANASYGAGLTAPAPESVNMFKEWLSEFASNPRYGPLFTSLKPHQTMKLGNSGRIVASPKANMIGKEGTIMGIGIVPGGTHQGKLYYKLRLTNGSEKMQIANSMTRIGGKRRTHAKKVKRRGTHRRAKK